MFGIPGKCYCLNASSFAEFATGIGADIVSALQQVDGLVSVLCEWRTNVESKFADLYTKAEKLGEALEVTLVPPRVVKQSQYRSNVGNCQNAADYYRVNVYVPLLESRHSSQ